MKSSTQNPLQIAILRWYDANLTTHFTVRTTPFGLAFAGTTIWVTNKGDATVSELQANDGKLLGTFDAGASRSVAFDGANIWVPDENNGTVIKLRATDGAVLGTFGVGSVPFSVAFDGANIWVANNGSNNVTSCKRATVRR